MSKNVIIIGAGPAGMTAAIFAARKGHKVTVLEHMDKPGKKLLVTGNGKCNLTNMDFDKNCYNSDNEAFPRMALASFGVVKTLDFLKSIGIYTKNKNGYIYPLSEQAASVLKLFLMELKRLKVKLKYNQQVTAIEKQEEGFGVVTPTYTYSCDAVVIATGSRCAPTTGSDGTGYDIVKSLGHKVITPLPALVSLKTDSKNFLANAKGVRVESGLHLYIDETYVEHSVGELQITDYGISGIMVFEISRHAVKALEEGKNVHAYFDFLPNITLEDLSESILDILENNPDKNITEVLVSFLNENLSKAIIEEMRTDVSDISEDTVKEIAKTIKHFKINVTGYNDYTKAQVCQGGVDTDEIYVNTMESKLCENVYIVGELMDVDGICGGYNLQWAFTSGALAGNAI